MTDRKEHRPNRVSAHFGAVLVAAAVAPLIVACAVEIRNTQPARELAEASRPAGSVYLGWRVYQDRCARCHGGDATGAAAPDLLPRLRTMGPQRFVDTVLRRYDWDLPPGQAGTEARGALIESILQRRAGALAMPAWQGEPRVSAHIADLYAYLSARAEGIQAAGKPAP